MRSYPYVGRHFLTSWLVVFFQMCSVSGQVGTAFTYQGRIKQNGTPVDGSCDFQFALYDAASDGSQIGSTVTVSGVTVLNGLFTVSLDFGGLFHSDRRFLDIQVRCPASSGSYVALSSSRQELTPAPYALALPGLHTENASSPNIIGGYSGNAVTAGVVGATIGGGGSVGNANSVTDDYGTVGGGRNNRAGDNQGRTYATVGGGVSNTASGARGTVGGGSTNTAGGAFSTVGGGFDNAASDIYTTVAGGWTNRASGTAAMVGGGQNNTASASHATVPGGFSNVAQGDLSFAAGYRAKANHQGTFVWADSSNADLASTENNTFIVRASGGLWFGNTSTPDTCRLLGFSCAAFLNTSTGAYLSISGNWLNSSDRSRKENYTPVDTRLILQRLRSLPISMWNYKEENGATRHLGPTAQDFAAAFRLGDDDTAINTLDADGVALAAIQGLYQELQDRDATISELRQLSGQRQNTINDLQARLAALEAQVLEIRRAAKGDR